MTEQQEKEALQAFHLKEAIATQHANRVKDAAHAAASEAYARTLRKALENEP
jgi:hypothetical protein